MPKSNILTFYCNFGLTSWTEFPNFAQLFFGYFKEEMDYLVKIMLSSGKIWLFLQHG